MIHRPCPMIGWSLVSSRLFSEQGACRGLRPAAGCAVNGGWMPSPRRPGPAVRPLVTHAHVLRLSFGPRRDWRGSVARRMPGGRFLSLLQDVHRRR